VDYFSYGSIDTFSLQGGQLVQGDAIQPGGYAVSLALGQGLGAGFSAGSAVKLVREDLGGQARMLGAYSLGADWRNRDGALGFGAVLQNLGFNSDVAMPVNASLGGDYSLRLGQSQSILIALESNLNPSQLESTAHSMGLEWKGGDAFALRTGYRMVGNEGASGFSAGFGYGFTLFQIDYAYLSEGVLGVSHQVSLGSHF
jgi:hypothetical protein